MIKQIGNGQPTLWEYTGLTYYHSLAPVGCNYHYVVTSKGAMSHTAFNKREEFQRWLDNRNLAIDQNWNNRIVGTYYKKMYNANKDVFDALTDYRAGLILSNGSITLGKFTEDEEGVVTIHYLNPNVKNRPIFDYRSHISMLG